MFASRRGSALGAPKRPLCRWQAWSLLASTLLIVTCFVGPNGLTGSGTTEIDMYDSARDDGVGDVMSSSASPLPPLQLPDDYVVTCGDELWHGAFEDLNTRDRSSVHQRDHDDDYEKGPPVAIALSYCEASLDWVEDAVRDLDVRRITVYSKCGQLPVKGLPRGAKVVELPNVGRVDHSYAYHLAHLPDDTDPNEIQLFMKDTHTKFHQHELRQRSLRDVVREAAGFTGYSCGRIPDWRLTFNRTSFLSRTWFHTLANYDADWSFWHLTREMDKFGLDEYRSNGNYEARDDKSFNNVNIASLSEWWDALGVRVRGPITPVCYAGVFAAKPENIIASRGAWRKMLTLLERGDNIVEGHYSERTYGAMLLPSLPPKIVRRLLCLSRSVRRCSHAKGYCGTLYGCASSWSASFGGGGGGGSSSTGYTMGKQYGGGEC